MLVEVRTRVKANARLPHLPVRQLHQRARARLAARHDEGGVGDLRAQAALRHQLLRAARRDLDPQRGDVARPVRHARGVHAGVRDGGALVRRRAAAPRSGAAWRRGAPRPPSAGTGAQPKVAVRSQFWSTPDTQVVLVEKLRRLADSTRRVTSPACRPALARTGRFASVRMPVVDRFEAALERTPPMGGWIVPPAAADSVLPRLRAHGVRVERSSTASSQRDVEVFMVDSISRAARPFQGHQEVTLSRPAGAARPARCRRAAGWCPWAPTATGWRCCCSSRRATTGW